MYGVNTHFFIKIEYIYDHKKSGIQNNKYSSIKFKKFNMSTKQTSSGRNTQKPELYSEQKFKAGSGFSGCDSYDRSYDDGEFWNSTKDDFAQSAKDVYQARGDVLYKAALEKRLKTETATQKLPADMTRIIQTMVQKTAYQNEIEFIASDDTPEKTEVSEPEEEEWISGSDTEDECDSDQEWD